MHDPAREAADIIAGVKSRERLSSFHVTAKLLDCGIGLNMAQAIVNKTNPEPGPASNITYYTIASIAQTMDDMATQYKAEATKSTDAYCAIVDMHRKFTA
jgi:hypothetical protein